MAVKSKSLFLYGLQVTPNNSSIDFVAVAAGPTLAASLTVGYYSLSTLLTEVKRALQAADPAHIYTVTADRTISGGTQNRVTISTNSTHLDLLFASGPRAASTSAPLLGFTSTDKTGATTYTGQTSSGTLLQPNWFAQNFIPPELYGIPTGVENVSSSGLKETVIFSLTRFWQCEFRQIPLALATTVWSDLLTWMIRRKPIDFTPEIAVPNVFYSGVMEKPTLSTGYLMPEMLPDQPDTYKTPPMVFRKDPS